MLPNALPHRLFKGIRRDPRKALLSLLVSIGISWGSFEMFAEVWPNTLRPWVVFILLLAAIVITFSDVVAPARINLKWDGIKGEIVIREGNIFNENRFAITCDDFFLTTIGKLVNENSLVGKLIARVYSGEASALDRDIKSKLVNNIPTVVTEADIDNNTGRYPVGTTVALNYGDRQIFVTALCKIDTDREHGSASATDLWQALEGLWRELAVNPKGSPIAIPLIGAGQTGVGLSAQTIIHLIISSYLAFVIRIKHIPDPIHVVLLPDVIAEVDLAAIRKAWLRAE